MLPEGGLFDPQFGMTAERIYDPGCRTAANHHASHTVGWSKGGLFDPQFKGMTVMNWLSQISGQSGRGHH